MLLRVLSYSIQEPRTKSAARLSTATASSRPAHWMKTNITPFQGASRKDAGQERCRRCAVLDASGPQRSVRALARPLQYLSRRVTPSLDFDAARSLISTSAISNSNCRELSSLAADSVADAVNRLLPPAADPGPGAQRTRYPRRPLTCVCAPATHQMHSSASDCRSTSIRSS
jgi:hypothetical protein